VKNIESLKIKSFKALSNVILDDCGDINIIIGNNNSGKTTILEAIYLLDYKSSRSFASVSRKRITRIGIPTGITPMESFMSMFNFKQPIDDKHIGIEFTKHKKTNEFILNGELVDVHYTKDELDNLVKNNMLRKYMIDDIDESIPVQEFNGILKYNNYSNNVVQSDIYSAFHLQSNKEINSNNPLDRVNYITTTDHINEHSLARLISRATEYGYKNKLLDLVKDFDSNILDIDILVNDNRRTSVKIKHEKYGYTHISNFGDGIKKVLFLAGSMLNSEDGILLIDEIETAIHTSGMNTIFKWLVKQVDKLNVQIFMTTHSDETLSNIITNSTDDKVDIIIYKMESLDDMIISRRYSEEKAYRLLIENGEDIR